LARHAKSRPELEYFPVPVPHELFSVEHAWTLLKVSRHESIFTGWESLPPKVIEFAQRAPESRLPRYDTLVEDDPRGVVCGALVCLFDRETDLLEDLPWSEGARRISIPWRMLLDRTGSKETSACSIPARNQLATASIPRGRPISWVPCSIVTGDPANRGDPSDRWLTRRGTETWCHCDGER